MTEHTGAAARPAELTPYQRTFIRDLRASARLRHVHYAPFGGHQPPPTPQAQEQAHAEFQTAVAKLAADREGLTIHAGDVLSPRHVRR